MFYNRVGFVYGHVEFCRDVSNGMDSSSPPRLCGGEEESIPLLTLQPHLDVVQFECLSGLTDESRQTSCFPRRQIASTCSLKQGGNGLRQITSRLDRREVPDAHRLPS